MKLQVDWLNSLNKKECPVVFSRTCKTCWHNVNGKCLRKDNDEALPSYMYRLFGMERIVTGEEMAAAPIIKDVSSFCENWEIGDLYLQEIKACREKYGRFPQGTPDDIIEGFAWYAV